jgi:hypothetical protein
MATKKSKKTTTKKASSWEEIGSDIGKKIEQEIKDDTCPSKFAKNEILQSKRRQRFLWQSIVHNRSFNGSKRNRSYEQRKHLGANINRSRFCTNEILEKNIFKEHKQVFLLYSCNFLLFFL